MPLFTKSIQSKKTKSDGIRVCIMRRPEDDADWDIWMPHLAPSHQLLTNYHKGNVNWNEYCRVFNQEVLIGENIYIQILIEMCKTRSITLLCWEEKPEKCHRRLVAEECMRLDPSLKVVIR
jgi:uncharacterized protein YeaO (DUF488 family)